MNLQNRTILLTGAAGGIGSLLAARLAQAGARLFLVDRQKGALETLKSHLGGTQVSIACADLSLVEERQNVVTQAWQTLGSIDVLINLAGCMSFARFEQEDPALTERLVQVNLLVPMSLTQIVLPRMLARGSGKIVNIGSIFGSIAFAYFSTYSSTKFALRGFSEGLRRELEGTGVGVCYIAPRAARTPFNNEAINQWSAATKTNMDSPDTVAKHIVRALEKDAKDYYIGWPEAFFVRINALFPRLVDRALRKQNQLAQTFTQTKRETTEC